MAKLINEKNKNILISKIIEAKSFWQRSKGLLGKEGLSESEGMWIYHCNSIHTFGMKFPIDCLFIDKSNRVCAIKTNIRPWRLVLPIWKAVSVIELAAGKIDTLQIEIGDKVYVGH